MENTNTGIRLMTTTCGSCPKQPRLRRYAPQFHTKSVWAAEGIRQNLDFLVALEDDYELQWLLNSSTREAIRYLDKIGIDIIAHPEQERANYVDNLLMRITGFDFVNLQWMLVRDVQETHRPRIIGPIRAPGNALAQDWRISQSFSNAGSGRPVKMTFPGPATIINSVFNAYHPYDDTRRLREDLIAALNKEVHGLYDAGCRHFQIDDAYLSRDCELALDHGIEDVERVFYGLPDDATSTLHMCRGYTNELNEAGYKKADKTAYLKLADALDASSIDAISLEDAYEYSDLSLFDKFKRATVVLGSVSVVKTEIEPVESIRARVNAVVERVGDPAKVVLAPDCGGAMLPLKIFSAKIRNMREAACL